jgi:hypothetical protein
MTDGRTDTVQTLPETNREYYKGITGGLMAVQEQNARFASALIAESFRAYASLFYVPFSPSRHRSGVEVADLPIEDYDRLTTEEIAGRLDELSAGEVEELKAYEKQNKGRTALIERFDRSLV